MATCLRCGKNCADGNTLCPDCQAWQQSKLRGTAAGLLNKSTNDGAKRIKPRKVKKEEKPAVVSAATCPSCGAVLIDGAEFCVSCGASLAQASGVQAVQEKSVASPAATCPSCGAALIDGAEFCVSCGASLAHDAGGQAPQKRSPKPHIIPIVVVMILVVAILGVGIALSHRSRVDADTATMQKETTGESSLTVQQVTPEPSQKQNDGEQPTSEPNFEFAQEPTPTPTPEPSPEPTYDTTEGGIHRYSFVVDDCTWSQAFQKALDSGGYLARINSVEEQAYLIAQIEAQELDNIQFRLGGRRDNTSNEYYWVDANNQLYGEALNSTTYWGCTNWMAGEPSYYDSNLDLDENCLCMYYNSSARGWVWNDVPDDLVGAVSYYSGKVGYIIEYED